MYILEQILSNTPWVMVSVVMLLCIFSYIVGYASGTIRSREFYQSTWQKSIEELVQYGYLKTRREWDDNSQQYINKIIKVEEIDETSENQSK